MLKKSALALFGLVLAITLMSPPKAAAEVHVGVQIGVPVVPYGAVVVRPAPYVAYGSPYYVATRWNSGYHDGYYWSHGERYRRDDRGYRHYDRGGRYDRDHYRGHYNR